VRFIVTGQDVIHDFAVPSLGLKIDAVPGRLNQTSVLIQREGTHYGSQFVILSIATKFRLYHQSHALLVVERSLKASLRIYLISGYSRN